MPSGGSYATYHLLGEPETTIDTNLKQMLLGYVVKKYWWSADGFCDDADNAKKKYPWNIQLDNPQEDENDLEH